MLACAVLAIFITYMFGNGRITLAMVAGLLAMAFALPDTRPREHAKPSRTRADVAELQSLSGEYLAEAVTDPLLIFDQNTSLVHANAAAFSAFGGIVHGMALPLRFRASEMQALLDAIVTGTVASQAVDYTEKLPIERTYRVSASAIGRGTGLYVLVFKDQSEARRIDRMRADFIANASHELRTPLASISGFIETLRGPARNDAAARDRFLAIMQEQTGRMARLIDDLLSLSRLEMKPFLALGSEVDITKVLVDVLDSLAPRANDNGVVIDRRFGDDAVLVPGNRDELFQVFENLFENACKYGESGGRVEISVGPGNDGPASTVDVTVRDFGPGIAEEHIPRITERFYRIEADGKPRKGTGLGLAIVKHILTRHNARLTIASELGKGAAFTVHLPARQVPTERKP